MRARRTDTPEETGTGGGAPIDLAHLSRQTFGSRPLEREVLGLFVEQTPDLVAAILDGAPGDRRAALHRLKGSARGIGADRIAGLAEALEAEGLSAAERDRLSAALAAAEAETRRFVERRLAAAD